MAVLDFRGGGFHGVRPRQVRDMMFGEQDRGYQPMDAQQVGPDGFSMAARATRALNYFGALVSVALMIGLVVWGYQLVVRDVSGIPVIRAIEGAARVAPDEPGGELAEHSGLAVNTVAAGESAARVDRVAIAPSAAGLTEEDVPMGQLGATAQPIQADDADAELAAPQTPVLDLPAPAAPADRMADAIAAESAADGSVSGAVTDEAGSVVKPEDINKALAEAAAPQAAAAIAGSARPAPRPRRVAAAAPAMAAVAATADTPDSRPAPTPAPIARAEVETVKPAAGSAIAQIGAFDSDAVARSEWQRLSGKNGGLFAGKSPVIQKTERNGRTFWRLRVAGFGGKDDARSFCSSLKAKGTDCIALSN